MAQPRDPATGRFVSAGGGGAELGTAVGRIVIDASGVSAGIQAAQSAIETGLSGIGDRITSLGDQISSVGAAITKLTAPISAFGAIGISVAADFDSAMAEISARTQLTGESLEEIRQLALQMGADTAFSAQDAAEAFLQLLSSGQTAQEAIATLPSVLTAAAASGAQLGETADTVTDIMAMFNLQAGDAGMIVDAMARASGASSATMADLGQAFRGVGGIARRFGIDVNTTASILAIFAENGVKGAQAGQLLESMLTQMSRNTKEATDAWDELDLSLYNTDGSVRDFSTVIDELKGALSGLPVKEQNRLIHALAGSYGQAGLSALLGSISIDEMNQRMSESADATDIAQARMDTFSGRLESLKGSVESLMIEALTPLMDTVLTPLIERVTEIVNGVTAWTQENPELAAQIVQIGAVVAVAGPAIFILGQALSAIGSVIGFIMSPLGLLIGGILALTLAIRNNFLGIRDFLQPIIDNVAVGVQTLFGVFANLGTTIEYQGVERGIAAIINAFMQMMGLVENDQMSQFALDLGDVIYEALNAVITFITGVVIPGVQTFIQLLSDFWTSIQPGLNAFFTWVTQEALPIVVDFFQNIISPAVSAFITILSSLWAAVSPALSSLFNWFVTSGLPFISSAIGAVVTVVGDLVTRFSEFVAANPEFVLALGAIGIAIVLPTALVAAFGVAVSVVTGAVGLLTTALGILFSPIVIVVAAITALLFAVNELYPGGLSGALRDAATSAQMLAAIFLGYLSIAATWARDRLAELLTTINNIIAKIQEFKTNLETGVGGLGNIIGGLTSGQFTLEQVFGAINAEITAPSRDSGGSGMAGMPYLIGRGAQPELFIPSTNGTFVPNADRLMGGGGDTYHIEIYANSRAGGEAAAEGFEERFNQLRRKAG